MSSARKASLWTAAVVVAGIAGALFAIRRIPHTPPGIPPDLVPPSWAEYRTSLGHREHVGKGSIVCNDCHTQVGAGFHKPEVDVCTHCHAKEAGQTHRGGAKPTDCLV